MPFPSQNPNPASSSGEAVAVVWAGARFRPVSLYIVFLYARPAAKPNPKKTTGRAAPAPSLTNRRNKLASQWAGREFPYLVNVGISDIKSNFGIPKLTWEIPK
jgi:hypothetical protein